MCSSDLVEVLVKGRPRCTAHVNPHDAARLGVVDGADVRVASSAGEVVIAAEVTDEVMEGVVSIPHGWGHDLDGVEMETARRHAGVNTNVLVPTDCLDPLSGNAVLTGVAITLAPV